MGAGFGAGTTVQEYEIVLPSPPREAATANVCFPTASPLTVWVPEHEVIAAWSRSQWFQIAPGADQVKVALVDSVVAGGLEVKPWAGAGRRVQAGARSVTRTVRCDAS